jgi:hypothetical protein
MDFSIDKGAGSYTLSIDVVTSDLPTPSIKSMQCQAKFIDQDSSSNMHLGYKIIVVTDAIDRSEIPHKYLVDKPIDLGDGKTITQLPIQDVYHEVHFTFVLKDEDGFKLLELQSEQYQLASAKSNTFQGIATSAISKAIASRTRSVYFQMSIDKCTTCQ